MRGSKATLAGQKARGPAVKRRGERPDDLVLVLDLDLDLDLVLVQG